jgi:3-deoxy-D-manno-octulosonic-acid transferase
MLFFYRVFINLIFLLSPLIIIVRLLKKKESIKRFSEKLCVFSEKKIKGNLIWFHGASVGEIQSIVPLLEKFEKNKKIKQILLTSNTLSSSKIVENLRIKKIVHQFFPIDTNFISNKFLNYWKPSAAFFIDSEVWPNMYLNLKKRDIPITLLNGRITKKSFSRWNKLPKFSKKIFSQFDLCLSSNNQTKYFLKKLGAQNIKFLGNLKYSQTEKKEASLNKKLEKFISSKETWCASSTHFNEERFCSLVHKQLKKKHKNLLTIIIPRHIERVDSIKNELIKLNLKVHTYQSQKTINSHTDIFIVDAYGKTKSFYNNCKNVFLGGSLINHGGQNPLEAVRYGCNILHGPNIGNFEEIYKFLKKNKMSQKINNQKQMANSLNSLFLKKNESKKIKQKMNLIGKKVLISTYDQINVLLKNEI